MSATDAKMNKLDRLSAAKNPNLTPLGKADPNPSSALKLLDPVACTVNM
jgi:hypothetical protein